MKVILIDGRNAVYRFGWVHRNLRSPDGEGTGVVYGILDLLIRLKRRFEDSKFVVVWDGEGPSWRHKMFEGYKANRKDQPMPVEIAGILQQIPLLEKTLKMIGIPQLKVEGVECDDVIGILCAHISGKAWQPVVYSNDQDFIQLMVKGVMLVKKDDGPTFSVETEAHVREKFRCNIRDIIKVRALAGDKSDNIPNVYPGIGPVKAAALIGQRFEFEKNAIALRNYRLMKIVDSIDFELFTMEERERLREGVSAVMKSLEGSKNGCSREALTFLGNLGMVEVISMRREIDDLQIVIDSDVTKV
jgi:DNA polymerase I